MSHSKVSAAVIEARIHHVAVYDERGYAGAMDVILAAWGDTSWQLVVNINPFAEIWRVFRVEGGVYDPDGGLG